MGEVPTVPPERVHEPLRLLLRDLRSSPRGLSQREAARRLVVSGPNELRRRGGRTWPSELLKQVTHPLALLLWVAAALAVVAQTAVLAVAIIAVILLNAAFAFIQERQAERAVEALSAYLPARATVLRDGHRRSVEARDLVPGDVVVLAEGDAVCADARLLDGSVEVDMSTLTGESAPVERWAAAPDEGVPLLEAPDLLFSGTTCVRGAATAVVYRTGMATEIGRIAALTERVTREQSPLELQVRRVAWLIAVVATGVGVAFMPLGVLAGLPPQDAFVFAVGILVANVPEGLLPTITLALAVGVAGLAKSGALVKRLSAVETLGSTDVICTDKTGTLTRNDMDVVHLFDATARRDLMGASELPEMLAESMLACSTVEETDESDGGSPRLVGDPTEVALLEECRRLGLRVSPAERDAARRTLYAFDPVRRLMSTVDASDHHPGSGPTPPGTLTAHTKGAPEEVLARCTRISDDGTVRTLTTRGRAEIEQRVTELAGQGLRLIGFASRPLGAVPQTGQAGQAGAERDAVESDLTFLGVACLLDPARPEVPDAVARCHEAGIRIHVITGDHGSTAAAIARQVGIGVQDREDARPVRVVEGSELDAMSEGALDHLLRRSDEVVFARSSPEAKLRIADALRHEGHVVAMTGDGVNDAPALQRADIGVAMGITGTDVAREASTMILTDDNFATIVSAVEAGRRVYDNVRKFVLYIFAHLTPEVVPFLVFALSGGAIPLPLTVLQILVIDLGTETLPALALGREPAEPGLMRRPPRRRSEGVITKRMLVRAWGLMGSVSAALVMVGYFVVLVRGGWSPGDPTGPGTALHETYLQATTMTFAGIVACQVGTAFAARTDHASLRSIGVLSNPLLLWGIAFELVVAAAVIYLPVMQDLLGTRALPLSDLALLAVFPFVVWGADEAVRALERVHRRHHARAPAVTAS